MTNYFEVVNASSAAFDGIKEILESKVVKDEKSLSREDREILNKAAGILIHLEIVYSRKT